MVRARRAGRPAFDPTAPKESESDFYLEMKELLALSGGQRRDVIESIRASWRTATREEKLEVMEYDHEEKEYAKADHKERLFLGFDEPISEKEDGWIRVDRLRRLGRYRRLEAEGPRPTDRKSIDAAITKLLSEETAADRAKRVKEKRKAKKRRARFLRIIDAEIILLDPADVPEEPEPVSVDTSAAEAFTNPVVELVPRDPSLPRKPRRRPGISGVSFPYDD